MKRLLSAIIFACLLPSAAIADGIGPKPGRWCGWFLQHELGITSKATGLNLNRAIEWSRVGQAAEASVGAIVVWRHHVGVIVGKAESGGWIVKSGNDGNTVRTRERSLRGVVAFRSAGGPAIASSNDHSLNEKAPARRNKHLIAHAVGGRAAKPLSETGTLAVSAGETVVSAGLTLTHRANLTDEIRGHKRKPVRQPQDPRLVVAGGDAVNVGGAVFGELEFSHDASPHTGRAQAASRPSSRASQGSERSRLHAHAGLGYGGHALFVDAAVEMNATLRPEQSPGYRRRYTRGLPTGVTASRRVRGRG